ncbi:MAG: glycosyltransferase family 1 protein [Clostridiaceae bacterium]
MSKIIFNATIISDKPNGLSLYCINILKRVKVSLTDSIIKMESSEIPNPGDIQTINIKTESSHKLFSVFLRNHNFKRKIKELAHKNLLIYSPTQHGITTKGIRQVITVHDLLPLLYPAGRFHQYFYYRFILPKVIKNSVCVITVSENTKSDIIKHYKVNPEKIHVVYNGFDKPQYINIEESKKTIKDMYNLESYILMMGINYRYKNLHSIISAYSEIKDRVSYKLVIAGNYNVGYGKELIHLSKSLGVEDRVVFLGYVDNDVKHKLYQASKAFVYPSLYEGFGLPVLEAMANQTPVICSETSSLPEVAGDAAIYMNSQDTDDVERALLELDSMTGEERDELIRKGNERVRLFSWEKCADKVFDILSKAGEQEYSNG